MRYAIQPIVQKFVNQYGFFHFLQENLVTNMAKKHKDNATGIDAELTLQNLLLKELYKKSWIDKMN